MSIGDMAETLRVFAGNDVANLIQWDPDPFIQEIVNGWPPEFDTRKAKDLGFIPDTSMEAVIQAFIEDEL